MLGLILVLYTCLVFARVSSSTTSIICEHKEDTVRCPGTKIMKVKDAFYGRDDLTTCGGPALTTHCRSSVSIADIKHSCDGKSSCRLRASNNVYGDPCPHTKKFIRITYDCIESSSTTSVICEHNKNTVRCPGTKIIKVKDAFYGRDDLSTCGGPALTTHCRSSVSITDIKNNCDGKSSCRLWASNNVYGDPCPHTKKFIRITYDCIESSSTSSVICEHNKHTVRCPGTKIIKVKDAFYGRDDLSTCGGPAHTTNCRSSVSIADIKYNCDGKSSCGLWASNNVYGDPCPRTKKFIRITYDCIDGGALICENHEGILSCPASTVMKVQSAFYGRDDPTTCGGPVKTTCCLSAVSETKIKHSCNGRRACALKASNNRYGDPCLGTRKYIRVIYSCVPE